MVSNNEDVNSIEITTYDLQRMRGEPPNDRYAKFLRKKEELRKLSQERYNKWPNTISAMREKRLADKKRELEKAQEDLNKQDVIDAKNRAERRRQQIEKANKMLKVIQLSRARSKLMMSSIHEERQAHIQYRHGLDELWKKQEDKWVNFQRRQREGWREEEKQEAEKTKQAVQALKKGRLDQLEERRKQVELLKELKEKDKMQLRKQAEEDELKARQKEEEKRQKAAEAVQQFIAINKEQQRRKELQKEKLKEEEKKIAEYAAYRERVEDERKQARAKKEAEKAVRREEMLARLEKQLLAARTDTAKRLTAQEQAYKQAEEKKEQDKAERARADWEECDQSRKRQLRLKKEKIQRNKQDQVEEALEVQQRLRLIDEEVKAEEKSAKEKRVQCSKQNLRLAVERRDREAREREESKKEYQAAFKEMENDIPPDELDEDDY